MRRHLKGMIVSIIAAKLGRFLHRRGHYSAAEMLQHELHRRGGRGHGRYGRPHRGRRHNRHHW